MFILERGDDDLPARKVCADCPVAADCLAEAVTLGERGIWGGTSERERRRGRNRPVRVLACRRCSRPFTPAHPAEKYCGVVCRDAAHRDQQANSRRRPHQTPRPPARHGTRSKYAAGCRCEPCRLVESAYQRERHKRRKAERVAS